MGDSPKTVYKESDRQDDEDLDTGLQVLEFAMMLTFRISENADAEYIEVTGITKELVPTQEVLMKPITQAQLIEAQQRDAGL